MSKHRHGKKWSVDPSVQTLAEDFASDGGVDCEECIKELAQRIQETIEDWQEEVDAE
jgi:hypothetical protein